MAIINCAPKYYKFTNQECIHNGYEFREGINTDTREWNTAECRSGGIYICRSEEFYLWTVHSQ